MSVDDIPLTDETAGRTAKTTVTSFQVIEALKRRDGAGVSELAADLGLSKGTVHKHLTTLRSVGYVVKEGTVYRLSLSFLGLGSIARARRDLYKATYKPLEKLAAATGEVASVMVPEHGYGVYLRRFIEERQPDLEILEGERVPLHATAGGKAILAYMATDERERILDHRGLSSETEDTVTDRETLAEELRNIHDRRIAHDRGELHPDRHCVAGPITDQDNRAIGAVTVSGPADRMVEKSADSDFPSIVGSTATSIRNRLHTGN